MSDTHLINKAFLKLRKRAESSSPSKLVETFVDAGPLFTLLSNPDHQIIYGRRGTGKTHAMVYLAERVKDNNDLPIYVDMRKIGSTGGIYSDLSAPIAERATRLLSDTLATLHDEILEYAIDHDDVVNLSQTGNLLDDLAESLTEVRVTGPIEDEITTSEGQEESDSSSLSGSASTSGLNADFELGNRNSKSRSQEHRITRSGELRHRVHFGRVGGAIQKIISSLPSNRVWLLLDEWSSVPIDLQPYLADLLRRSVFPTQNLTVKIAAIEQRSNFQISGSGGEYTGIELGADASANLNLDDFMVFENDQDRATDFFRQLVYRHYSSVDFVGDSDLPDSPEELIKSSFTQINTFEEFVRSAEGVPRDAINVLALAAQKDMSSPISMSHIRSAARTWYQRAKEDAVTSNPEAQELLHWIIDEVIAHRRARAFLLQSNTRHKLIDDLFDARVIHLLKKNISAHDEPGVRYDVYKLDYGCYVHLINTAKAPQGMLFEDDSYTRRIEVPQDDYRAIRRAILDLNEFEDAL